MAEPIRMVTMIPNEELDPQVAQMRPEDCNHTETVCNECLHSWSEDYTVVGFEPQGPAWGGILLTRQRHGADWSRVGPDQEPCRVQIVYVKDHDEDLDPSPALLYLM